MSVLSFRLPSQLPPTRDSFDTRAEAVRRWVAELPEGHRGETARRLYEMLREVNRLQISAQVRFELLEIIEGRLLEVLDSLEQDYLDVSLPLPQKSVRAIQLANALLNEVVNSCQAVLSSDSKASWLFRISHHQLWLVSMHRLLFYLFRIVDNYRQLHRHIPSGLWVAIHRIYLKVREEGQLSNSLWTPYGWHSSVEEEYKRVLLQSLLVPQQFRRSQLAEMKASMRMWVRHVHLLDAAQRSEGLMAYCVRFEHDAPHSQIMESCCSACDSKVAGVVLDLSQLARALREMSSQMGESGEILLEDGKSRLSRGTLDILLHAWRQPTGRREERVSARHELQLAIGMSVVHALQGEAGDVSCDSGHDGVDEIVLPDGIGLADLQLEASTTDVWDSIFYATEVNVRPWAREPGERETSYTAAEQLNYTQGGCCVRIPLAGLTVKLRLGELIGMEGAGGASFELYMVRWAESEDDAVIVGMQRLAVEVEAVDMVVQLEGRSSSLYALLATGLDGRPLLFVPCFPGLREKRVAITTEEGEFQLTLHEKVIASPLFEAYDFGQRHSGARPEDGGVSRDAAVSGDQFADLWDSL